MDPLSISASIAGIATAVFQISGYLSTVSSGGKNRLSLLNEVTHLWLTITAFQAQFPNNVGQETFPQELLSVFESHKGVIEEIGELVNTINAKVKPESGLKKIRQSLTWPLTQQDVSKLVEQIHRLQQTLQFALAQLNHSLTQEIFESTQAVKALLDEAQMKELIDWLSPLNFIAKQQMLFREHHEGTCKWFLNSPDFREWIEQENGILLCQGIPGAGKTLLSSIVINELDEFKQRKEETVKYAAVLMLYCKWDDLQSQSIDSLLGSLLKQIAQRYGVKSKEMIAMFAKHSGTRTKPAHEELIDVLNQELQNFPRSFIVIDGLDELRQEKNRLVLIETLTSLTAKVNLMVTSRPLDNIMRHFIHVDSGICCDLCSANNQPYQYHCYECDSSDYDICQSCIGGGKRCKGQGHSLVKQFSSFKIEVSAVEEDLLAYVQWRITSSEFLQKCVEMKEGLMDKIINSVVKGNEGMFLLAKFNMDTLTSKLRPGEVVAALNVLPNELDGTYSDAMGRIADLSSNQREVAMDFLCWVVFAKEPLKIRAIEHAIAVTATDDDIDQDYIIQAQVLASMCAGLVQFDESDCARLVHYTAQDFFRRNWSQLFPEGSVKLASTCLTYLLFNPFKIGACSGPTESTDFDKRVEDYPFLSYASKHWGKHLLETPQDDLWDRARTLLNDDGYVAALTQALWYLDNDGHTSWAAKDGSSALHLATYYGLSKLVVEFLEEGINPDLTDINGVTPLALAVEIGNLDVAKALINAGASLKIVDNAGEYLLYKAVALNQTPMVKLLLEQKDTDVNIADPKLSSQTPLILAAQAGLVEIVQLLLALPGLEIDKTCSEPDGATALSIAARKGNIETVNLLLNHPSIDIDHQDAEGSTALVYASESGNASVVEALLNKGANTEILQNNTEGTALMRAIDENAIPVVRLLLRYGANVHHKDCFDRGMLHSAACNGQSEMIRILLDIDSTLDVNMQDKNGKTTLHDVARLGYDATARVLLDHGADPSIKDNFGRTPIRVARDLNYAVILKMLREARREREEKRGHGDDNVDIIPPKRTDTGTLIQPIRHTDTDMSVGDELLPLWGLARANLSEELQKRLSANVAEEIDLKDPDMGETALHHAVAINNADIVRQLISNGASINIGNNYQRTPLHLAAMYNCFESAEILLDAGVNIDALDQWGAAPLAMRMASSQKSINTLLIERGAKLPDEQHTLNLYLQLAIVHGSSVAVRRLVEAGAEIWRKDWYGRTPFMIARNYERENIANLLLELGNSSTSSSSSSTPSPISGMTDESGSTNDTEETDRTSILVSESDEDKTLLQRERLEKDDAYVPADKKSMALQYNAITDDAKNSVDSIEAELVDLPEKVPAIMTVEKSVSSQTHFRSPVPLIASAALVLIVTIFLALHQGF